MEEYRPAVHTLNAVIKGGKSLDSSLSKANSPLSRQICYGVLRNYFQLDALVNLLLAKPLAQKHFDIHVLLLCGIYSVDSLNRPSHTSVNALVESVVGLRKPWAKGLVNGVLRNYLRNRNSLLHQLDGDEEAVYNHPSWLMDRIKSAYGELLDEIVTANNTQAPMTLRVNLSRIQRFDYQAKLSDLGISSSLGNFAASALYLSDPVQVDDLPGFGQGLVSVQDEASQLVVPLLNLQSGHCVLDACSAPGGKSTHMLESHPGISLTAIDRDADRLLRVRENLTRLNQSCDITCADLLTYQPKQPFDRILLDAPCSATGIIRRHPDIKLLRKDTDIDKLATTQLVLLARAFSLLKENGELVYSTCSILPDENDRIISAFREQNEAVVCLPINAACGHATENGHQLLPSVDGTDGFFFARLKKKIER